jgi:integrase/recombinase XerD
MSELAEVEWPIVPESWGYRPPELRVVRDVSKLGELRDGYLRHLERRGRVDATRTAYRRQLDRFIEWVGDRELSRQLLEEWQDSLAGTLKPTSRNVQYSVIRGLLRWAASEELVSPALWLKIDSLKVPKREGKPIPHEDLLRIARHLHDQVEVLRGARQAPLYALERALRTRSLFLFIFTTGARISEALSVRRDGYDHGQVRVIQKGGTEKILITTPTAEAAIAAYLGVRTDQLPALFLSYPGGQVPRPLTTWGARDIWLHLAGDIGIRSFGSHRIRHSTATELGEAQVADQVIENQMGHTNIATTRGYQKMRTGRRREAVEGALEPLIAPPAAPARPLYLKPLRRRGRRRST